ncbi:NEW3 domain-containing protein [uncultured Sphaerochaeta sp.]|uniref:COG1470 family protein n=1 Tax=uncultured Sphaerochaeta sp. TaxID=886478 RepID=UPI002A0A894A|nr:NEW3 domain-containing protein [uncultured Sphaerochaeta sp.]
MKKNFRTCWVVLAIVLLGLTPLVAATTYEGLSVATSYPSLNVSNTDMIVFDLTVKNYNLAPQRVNLSVAGLPTGWEYQFVGGGGLINAVFAEPDKAATVQLWVVPTKTTTASAHDFTVVAKGEDNASFSLPLTVTMGQKLPQRLALDTELPTIEGAADSDFAFEVTLHNNSAAETLVDLAAKLPDGFTAKFAEQYASKNENTLSIAAGAAKTLKVTVTPPQGLAEGTYPVTVIAKAASASANVSVNLQVQGQARLSLTGEGGLLSGNAVAGKERVVTLELKNSGTADAKDIKLSAYSPTNWNVTFSPEKVDVVAAGKTQTVKATLKPSSQAITGDYSVTLKADSTNSGNISTQYRVTVKTSSLWGIVSILIIAAAAVILVFAIKKFGRR